MRHFQDEVKYALIKYALVPIMAVATLGIGLAAYDWESSVVNRSEESVTIVGEVLSSLISDYKITVSNANKELGKIDLSDMDADKKRDMYEAFYHEINIRHENAIFYVFDNDMNPIMTNSTNALRIENMGDILGIFYRMKNNPGQILTEFLPAKDGNNRSLAIGCSIFHENKQQGYIIFIIPAKYLENNIYSDYMSFAITDRFGSVPLTTNHIIVDSYLPKLLPSIYKHSDEIVKVKKYDYYIKCKEIAGTEFSVYSIMPVEERLNRYFMGAAMLLGIFVIMLPLIFVGVRRENIIRASIISELKQLESQFKPHFIFNTLENIKFMIRLNQEDAVKMIVDLSAILRYSINNTMEQVPMCEDRQYIEAYLEILKFRFGDRLNYNITADEELMNFMIPKLVLQPIVENAIKYGEDADGNIKLEISVIKKNNNIEMLVKDYGVGMSTDIQEELEKMFQQEINMTVHNGIYNSHRRVQLIYGNNYGIVINTPDDGGTEVRIIIPYSNKRWEMKC